MLIRLVDSTTQMFKFRPPGLNLALLGGVKYVAQINHE